jgi:hypothetical protein
MFSDYWWDAYLWNINGIVVWPVWLTLLCIAVVLIIQMIEFSQKRKRNSVLIFTCIVGSLLMPFTGEFSGELAFRQACAKDAGFKVYKKQTIPKSELFPISSRADAKGKNSMLIYEDYGFEINQTWFEERFLYAGENSKYIHDYEGVKYSNYKFIEIKSNQILSEYKNYYGYSGFMSQGIRMCEKVNNIVSQEILQKRVNGHLRQVFNLEGIRYE